ncbi:pentraxin-related protein PTX3 [Latimeria chalumnae]|uniref:pentraxin-related protein PTX3 n=1 Tax=Latimeria chalumnae TaxID=7897 RepID=UPI0003C13F6D|nr:PREDICTED: pentraxin-related protein PTX3 isoform X2 [Latimeria chalumnae]XP_014347570.1 PREDICTED: pentraxin-related protein PTX3 isoform X1 [Latimeria chalumnae]|eukprot:XP_006002212.1 PREDICTED: pentraxin-related protein PTX3 isoform X2 [Latimeria chalumnae]
MLTFKLLLCSFLYLSTVWATDYESFQIIPYSNEDQNEITEGEDSSPCQKDFTKWDKLFVMMENSQMRENMLLQAANEVLTVELQSMRAEMLQFVTNFASTCANAIDRATSHITQQVCRKVTETIGKSQEAKARQSSVTEKLHEELLHNNQEIISRLSHLERAWQDRAEAGTPTTGFYVGELENTLHATVNLLQQTRDEIRFYQKWASQRFLPAGCEFALLFPMRSKKIFGSVHPESDMTLNSFTACIWAKATDVLNKTILFSYGTKRNPSQIQLYLKQRSAVLAVGTDHDKVTAKDAVVPGEWTSFCTTWNSVEGNTSLWVNGQLAATMLGMAEGHSIPNGGILQLGQEKNGCCVGGGFDEKLAFSGKLTGFNIWDSVLSEEEIVDLAQGENSCQRRGNIVGWGVTEIIPHGGAHYIH